jgi:hypothetical protein
MNRIRRGAPNFSDLSDEGKEKMREQVLQATTAGTSATPSSASSSISSHQQLAPTTTNSKSPVVLVANVLSIKPANRELLPVPIQSCLPHIHLKVGPAECDKNPVEISCLVDSAASLTNSNFYYCSKIAKAFPHLVHSVLTSETNAPIVMSGIVHTNGSAVTAELPVAFIFHLPYLSRDGSPTTLSVATGPHTGVNLIVGLPFCESTGLTLNFTDNVADCKSLTCPPFPLFKKQAGVQLPSLPEVKVNMSSNPGPYDTFLTDLENLERNISSAYDSANHVPSRRMIEPTSSANTDPSKSVSFALLQGTSMQLGVSLIQPDVYRADLDATHNDDGSRGCHDESDSAMKPPSLPSRIFTDVSERAIHTPDYAPPPPPPTPANSKPAPIRPAIKPKKGKHSKNVFLDNWGFSDQSHDHDVLLHNIDGHTVLRKRKHPPRPINDAFNVLYDEALHGDKFRKEFKPSLWLTADQNEQVAQLIKKYWCLFDDTGLFIPVKDYECEIDTSDSPPIAVKKINYGPYEMPIMQSNLSPNSATFLRSTMADGYSKLSLLLRNGSFHGQSRSN